jgi:hypothetical protein
VEISGNILSLHKIGIRVDDMCVYGIYIKQPVLAFAEFVIFGSQSSKLSTSV